MSQRERFVLLGVARPRADWFARLGRWATAASVPVEFVRCISLVEVRARLESGRRFSAVILDGTLPGADRDLFEASRDAGVAVFVVDDRSASDWMRLGAARILPPFFDRETFVEALHAHADMVGVARLDDGPGSTTTAPSGTAAVIAVTGPGGTGASTAATALAQGLGTGRRASILLADLRRRADLAMLHDSKDVIPGVQELVESHRAGRPHAADMDRATFNVPERSYRLLLGLRHERQWATIRPQAFGASLETLTHAFDALVCDVDPDVDGEQETGSRDLEDRNTMSRQTILRADAVVVVGAPGMKGLHSLVRLILDLDAADVNPASVVPVINRAGRSPRDRAEATASLSRLLRAGMSSRADALPSPVFLPTRRVDEAFRDGVPLPRPLPALLVGAVTAALRQRAVGDEPTAGPVAIASSEPRRIMPGSLGLGPAQESA